ncbi:MAG: DUF4255 domain-containing protein [Methylococcales bacterium]|nr:DUF4255 domain-containing protein [Methylococcales bacterium]
MIQTALVFIKKKLDQYLVNSFKLDESIAVLNHLVGQDGSCPKKNQNKMVITLINLDYETFKQFQNPSQRTKDNSIVKTNPAVQFNVDLLFTACFDDYEEALKFLTATIAFFQSNNSFNSKTTPDIPNGIKTLNFEIEKTSYFEIHNLWNAMGAKYQPSIIYKVRHISIQSSEIKTIVSAVTDTDAKVQS